MFRKVLFIIGLFFLVQVITSCLFHCPEPGTFENRYYAVQIEARNTSGFYDIPVTDSVFKNTFGLIVAVNFESVQIANKGFSFQVFNTAMAFSCVGDTYLYPDPIDYIEIYVLDTKTQIRQKVSECFGVYGYSTSEPMTLDEFFEIREDWHDGFQFELIDYKTIPDDAVFIAEALLESGQIFTAETAEIHFKTKLKK
jgi:hypothetical protein